PVDADAELLAAWQERPRLAPAPRLIRPDDGAGRERARSCTDPVSDETCHEPYVAPPAAADEKLTDRRSPQDARPEEQPPQERNAIELVDPVQGNPECRRCAEGQARRGARAREPADGGGAAGHHAVAEHHAEPHVADRMTGGENRVAEAERLLLPHADDPDRVADAPHLLEKILLPLVAQLRLQL